MATGTTNTLLLLSILLPLFAISVAARPCKTIFFITTTTTSYYPSDQNPNFSIHQNPNPNPNQYFTFFVTEVHRLPNTAKPYPRRVYQPIFFDRTAETTANDVVSSKPHSFDLDSSVSSSIRDRTMDIMSIVGALLFGVGCGALTAATMYLIWSLFSPRRFDFGDSDDEFDDAGEDDASPKKMGYVTIPAAGAVTTTDLPAAPAKESGATSMAPSTGTLLLCRTFECTKPAKHAVDGLC